MTKMNDVDKIIEREIIKINIFSANEDIVNTFLKTIKAKKFRKLNIGVEFAFLLTKEKRFQFWITETDLIDENSIFSYLKGSKGIIFFYKIDEKINEECLKIMKNGIQGKIPMIFVRYDSDKIDPSENITEMNYQNFETISKYFKEYNLMYLSPDNDSMDYVLNKIVEINDIKQEKRGDYE